MEPDIADQDDFFHTGPILLLCLVRDNGSYRIL